MRGIRHDVCITSSASFLTPVHQWLWNRDLIRRNAFYLFIFYNAPELNCYPPEVALNQVHDHRISHDSLRKRNYSLHQLGFNLLPSETSLSVQWKDANYLLHSRWWLFFFLGSNCFLYKFLDDCWKSVCSVSSVILFQCHVSFKVELHVPFAGVFVGENILTSILMHYPASPGWQ